MIRSVMLACVVCVAAVGCSNGGMSQSDGGDADVAVTDVVNNTDIPFYPDVMPHDVPRDIPMDSPDAICDQVLIMGQRCNLRACLVVDARLTCVWQFANFRQEYLDQFNQCYDPFADCPSTDDSGADASPMDAGICGMPPTVTPTETQLFAASALCRACPQAGGGTVTTATDCMNSIFAASTSGQGQGNGVGAILVQVNDSVAQRIGSMCASSLPDADMDSGSGDCEVATVACVVTALNLPATTCSPDGGL